MTTMKSDSLLLVKSNSIIRSMYDSTLMVNRILDVAISELQLNTYMDGEDLTVVLSPNKIRSIIGVGNSIYSNIKGVAASLTGLVIGYEDDENKKLHYTVIVVDTKYDGKLTITFNKQLRPLLIDFKNKFTQLYFDFVMRLESVYSYRLYQILKSVAYPGTHECRIEDNNTYYYTITVDELRLRLGSVDINEAGVSEVLKDSIRPNYKKAVAAANRVANRDWRDFSKNALKKAEKEISEKTDISLSIKPQKDGRTIESLVFKISYKDIPPRNRTYNEEVPPIDWDDHIKEVKDIMRGIIDISDGEALDILKAANNDLAVINEKRKIFKNPENVDNKVGWMIDAIKKNYKLTPGIGSSWKSNFHENHYDFARLEEELLEN